MTHILYKTSGQDFRPFPGISLTWDWYKVCSILRIAKN